MTDLLQCTLKIGVQLRRHNSNNKLREHTLDAGITTIAHVIQLAVAPVFLLSGIGAMLAVMTNRLGRIVDRARVLEDRAIRLSIAPLPMVTSELAYLSQRSRLISYAITLCTLTALLISAVIGVLFLDAFFEFGVSTVVAILFITAMLSFFIGLLTFLREIFLATATVRIGLEYLPSVQAETNPVAGDAGLPK